jgi:hypothetical protein
LIQVKYVWYLRKWEQQLKMKGGSSSGVLPVSIDPDDGLPPSLADKWQPHGSYLIDGVVVEYYLLSIAGLL